MATSSASGRDGVAQDRSPADRRRARELYKYFLPSDPALLDGEWQPKTRPGDAPQKVSSPNITLTAYAQYIAIRLNARRALISLISTDTLYAVAEATKTVNISNTDVYHEDGDSLWVGCQAMSKADRLCEHVIALEPPETGYAFFICNDLTKDDRFKRLPFVVNPPHFRFYAGTPLVTDEGINIGSVYVLDDKPRDGLDDDEKEFLGTMGTVCVSYLRTNREAVLRRKGARLTQSVRLFGEGRISFVVGAQPSMPGKASTAVSNDPDSKPTEVADCESVGSDKLSLSAATSQASGRGSAESLTTFSLPLPTSEVPNLARFDAERSTLKAFSGESGQHRRKQLLQLAQSDFEARGWTMARAANLVREALDLDSRGGVVFFDASKDFVHLGQDQDTQDLSPTSDEPDAVLDAHFQVSPRWGPPSGNEIRDSVLGIDESMSGSPPRKLACVLASSTAASPFALGSDVDYGAQAHQFPAGLLQRLLKKYPSGKVWAFDEDESIYSDQEDTAAFTSHPAWKLEQGQRRSVTMLRFFPRARHVIFVPLWDATKSHWAGGCFAWTTNETQLLDTDTDLMYVETLGRAVMNEIGRLETIQADQQKSDFIGSISHELRSPLHGILASLEFLHETDIDGFQKTLISTIGTCGRTLLDTINHVLDYSKINSFGREQKKDRRKIRNKLARTRSMPIDAPPLVSTYAITNVATILEEVIEGVKVGQQYRDSTIYGADKRSGSIQTHDAQQPRVDEKSNVAVSDTVNDLVDIDLDIEHGDWEFLTQPGALRRCFMNLFGNALKYTEKGSINVSLRLRELGGRANVEDEAGKLVIFQVADTGRGISAQFLRTKIYTPFAQEDSLAPGTGLGLSLVRNIVAMLDGRIDIESRLGHGTTVTIALPLQRRIPEEPDSSSQSTPSALSPIELERAPLLETSRLTVAIYGIEKDWREAQIESRVLRRVAGYVSEWLELPLIPWDEKPLDADVVILEKGNLPRLREIFDAKTRSASKRFLICIGQEMSDELKDDKQLKAMGYRVHQISKPCGPRKVGDVLQVCLEEAEKARQSPVEELAPDTHDLDVLPESEISEIAEKLRNMLISQPHLVHQSAAFAGLRSLLVAEKPGSEPPRTPLQAKFGPLKPLTDSSSDDATKFKTPTAAITSPTDSATERANQSGATTIAPATPSKATKETVAPVQPRILLVEDNNINLRLLQTFMNKRKLQNVDSAENGKLALEAVQRAAEPFDFIFMDISMPIMNGFEATAAIREHEAGQVQAGKEVKTSKIVALTGLASAEDQARANEVGMDLFLIKPVSFKEVAKLLDNWQPSVA